ncbi:MAG: 16S rRNA (uracil(1498)-N(3))-methyltransferase [Rickettsiales bacterium]
MSTSKIRYRLAVDEALCSGARVVLADNAAHYLTQVLRLKMGDAIALFNRVDGEWRASIQEIRKKEVVLSVEAQLRAPMTPLGLTVCFAPIKGGRMETIIEKVTELGASVLQPVITSRTIVDKVNLARAEAIAREAAEQCERVDWPAIKQPVKLAALLGSWPKDVPLVYGDESGESDSIALLEGGLAPYALLTPAASGSPWKATHGSQRPIAWGVLAGPEGGFTPEEFVALKHLKAAVGVGLGPRILRADTAVITLCVATLQRWGDWAERPRFISHGEI